MDSIRLIFSQGLNYIKTIGVADLIDIILVAILIYQLIALSRKTNSFNVAKGIVLLFAVLGIAYLCKLHMITFIFKKAFELGFIAIVILFQPELRSLLERIGGRLGSRHGGNESDWEKCIAQTVLACSEMSASRTGALIIFERFVNLGDIIQTGTVIDSETNAELLKNLFFNKAPLHDGAVIIRQARIAAGGCVLPLTKQMNLSKDLGMRHRAGIGLSEQSDAIVVIVSEETGAISLAHEGMLKRHLSPSSLEKNLRSELIIEDSKETVGFFNYIKKIINILFENNEK